VVNATFHKKVTKVSLTLRFPKEALFKIMVVTNRCL